MCLCLWMGAGLGAGLGAGADAGAEPPNMPYLPKPPKERGGVGGRTQTPSSAKDRHDFPASWLKRST